jgi:hypothetical protein
MKFNELRKEAMKEANKKQTRSNKGKISEVKGK